jgi:hypothetical protein
LLRHRGATDVAVLSIDTSGYANEYRSAQGAGRYRNGGCVQSEEAPIVDKVARSRAWIEAGLRGAIQLSASPQVSRRIQVNPMAPLRLDKKEGQRG